MSRGDIILRLVRLSKTYYGIKDSKALKNISVSFKRGEFVAIVGRSGSGKTTLVNILGGLDRPTGGEYYCEGNNVTQINEEHWDALRNKKIGFIFQNFFLIEYLTVYKNVEMALQFQNVPKTMKDAKIRAIIEKVGLIDHIHKLPSQLSGGQRQRVAIARALVKDPDIILADEPTGALDYKTADDVVKLLKGESEDRLVIMVTHDRKIANKYANRIIELDKGEFKIDIIKEDIEPTYQNVFRKVQPVSLKFKDKLSLTLKKFQIHIFKNIFIALSLALVFSLSIIFNGLNRGVKDAHQNYYEVLNQMDTYSFSLQTEKNETIESFIKTSDAIEESLNKVRSVEIVKGYSKDIVSYEGTVTKVYMDGRHPDLNEGLNFRLLPQDVSDYPYEQLFYQKSKLPYDDHTVMVTSTFIRDYFKDNDVKNYLGKEIELSTYSFKKNDVIKTKEVFKDLNINNYNIMRIPSYCFYKEDLDTRLIGKCETSIEQSLFTYPQYLEYMGRIQAIVQTIDENYFDLLMRSDAVFYFGIDASDDDIKSIYKSIYEEVKKEKYLESSIFLDTSETVSYTIVSILDHSSEPLVFMNEANYEQLFKQQDKDVELLKTMFTVHTKGSYDNDLNQMKRVLGEDYYLTNNDEISKNSVCKFYLLIDSKSYAESSLRSIFYRFNFNQCMEETKTNYYINIFNTLFSLFFNVLMVITILFFTMLIHIIFKSRGREIGILRSLGSTSRDIKRLFFYEAILICVLSLLMTGFLLLSLDKLFNYVLIELSQTESNVLNFYTVQLLMNNHNLTSISKVNLIVQSIIVLVAIIYFSRRAINTTIKNNNPIEILREDI